MDKWFAHTHTLNDYMIFMHTSLACYIININIMSLALIARVCSDLGGAQLETRDCMDFTGVIDIVQAGSAVGFNLPERIFERFNDESSWVLCLRAYIDAGPTDRPDQWDWQQPELFEGWDSTPEVFLIMQPTEANSVRLAHVSVVANFIATSATEQSNFPGHPEFARAVQSRICWHK